MPRLGYAASQCRRKTRYERWFAHVLPLTSGRRRQTGDNYGAVAAVFIRRTVPNALSPLEEMAKLYKLTASEVRVFDAVIKVNGVRTMADLLGLSQTTVKTHLHNLFLKTGTKRQSDLLIPVQAAHHNEMMSPAVTE